MNGFRALFACLAHANGDVGEIAVEGNADEVEEDAGAVEEQDNLKE